MNILEKLNDPRVQMPIYGWGVPFFIVFWAVAWYLDWVASTRFVSHMSMLALVLSCWAMWQGSRTEKKQTEQMEKEDERLEKEKQDKPEYK